MVQAARKTGAVHHAQKVRCLDPTMFSELIGQHERLFAIGFLAVLAGKGAKVERPHRVYGPRAAFEMPSDKVCVFNIDLSIGESRTSGAY
jgi:hypothetical protein